MVGELPGELTVEGGQRDNLPVYNVNYAEAEGFCSKLTELGHRSGDLPADWEFRVATEAQWEYACRAGSWHLIFSGGAIRINDRHPFTPPLRSS